MIDAAIQALARGEFILLYDFDNRERETVFESHDLRLDQTFDDRVEILHAIQLAVAHRVEKRLAFNLTRFNVLARAWARSQDLHRSNAPAAVRSRYQTLRNDVTEVLRQTRANHGLFVLRIKTDDAIDSLRSVDGVKSGKHEVTGFRGFQRNFSGLEISHFADQDYLGRLA